MWSNPLLELFINSFIFGSNPSTRSQPSNFATLNCAQMDWLACFFKFWMLPRKQGALKRGCCISSVCRRASLHRRSSSFMTVLWRFSLRWQMLKVDWLLPDSGRRAEGFISQERRKLWIASGDVNLSTQGPPTEQPSLSMPFHIRLPRESGSKLIRWGFKPADPWCAKAAVITGGCKRDVSGSRVSLSRLLGRCTADRGRAWGV